MNRPAAGTRAKKNAKRAYPMVGAGDGGALRRERERSQKSLRWLHEKTKELDPAKRGVSIAHLHRVEKGIALLTSQQIRLVARALEVPKESLFLDDACVVFQKSDYEEFLRRIDEGNQDVEQLHTAHPEMAAAGAYTYAPLQVHRKDVSITPKLKLGDAERAWAMQKYLLEIKDRKDGKPMTLNDHEGEEVVLVLEGTAQLVLRFEEEERTITLAPGDCAQYTASIPHGYRPARPGDAVRALFVYTRHGESGKDIVTTLPAHT